MINSQDKESIKRAIPKASNKILAAAVARLYIAYPEPDHWTPTGLAGAIVLVDDLVGHTFFLKLVDIVSHKGVLWDQELYIDFEYNQDRSFFHSFECEECYFGLLFEDKSEATSFYKKVKSRDKHGSKQTVQNKHGVELKKEPTQVNKIGFRGDMSGLENEQRTRRTKGFIYYEDEPPPEWRSLYRELESVGITEDMIAENREFIKNYIAQTGGPLVGLEPPIPRKYQYKLAQKSASGSNNTSTISKKAPPPPPPTAQKTASTPDLPKSDTPSAIPSATPSSISSRQETPASDPETPTPSAAANPAPAPAPATTATHSIPPPMHHNVPAPDYMPHLVKQRQSQEPPLPPEPQQHRGVPLPPPRTGAVPPPPPPSRNPVPPPPPSRTQPQLPPRESRPAPVPPPPRRGPAPPPPPSRSRPVPGPPRISSPMTTHPVASPPPQLPPHHPNPVPPAPSLPPSQQQPQSPYPQTSSIPAAPPPPPMQPATTQPSQSAPPPPPLPPAASQSGSAPPPPPPMPSAQATPANDTAAATPPPGAQLDGRDALLASIRNAGIGSLRKTDKSQLEKPNVLLQEARGEAPSQPASAAAPGQPASLADALAAALSNRKAKVANSDDEDEGDW
ncbi:hypothetical protein KL933_000962 [Ogataea haglerorum]|uniref:Actin assembly factor n=1 Tax=Ogataea haglerorum TaxID=1937702 RepID=A0AAN6D872_9ASCO|nr:hypothetical protein KL933_000962 [Ogataea haglerorum]